MNPIKIFHRIVARSEQDKTISAYTQPNPNIPSEILGKIPSEEHLELSKDDIKQRESQT